MFMQVCAGGRIFMKTQFFFTPGELPDNYHQVQHAHPQASGVLAVNAAFLGDSQRHAKLLALHRRSVNILLSGIIAGALDHHQCGHRCMRRDVLWQVLQPAHPRSPP